MSLRCPNCAYRLPWPEMIRFTRLHAVPCPGCGRLVALDAATRWYLLLAVLLLAAGLGSYEILTTGPATLVFLLALAATLVLVLRAGRLEIAAEDPSRRDP